MGVIEKFNGKLMTTWHYVVFESFIYYIFIAFLHYDYELGHNTIWYMIRTWRMISSISCKDICEFRKIWLNAPDGEMVLSPLDIVHCRHSVVILSSAAIQWTGSARRGRNIGTKWTSFIVRFRHVNNVWQCFTITRCLEKVPNVIDINILFGITFKA